MNRQMKIVFLFAFKLNKTFKNLIKKTIKINFVLISIKNRKNIDIFKF